MLPPELLRIMMLLSENFKEVKGQAADWPLFFSYPTSSLLQRSNCSLVTDDTAGTIFLYGRKH